MRTEIKFESDWNIKYQCQIIDEAEPNHPSEAHGIAPVEWISYCSFRPNIYIYVFMSVL